MGQWMVTWVSLFMVEQVSSMSPLPQSICCYSTKGLQFISQNSLASELTFPGNCENDKSSGLVTDARLPGVHTHPDALYPPTHLV